MLFSTSILHPNVNENGKICLDVVQNWSPYKGVEDILDEIYNLMINPDINNPLNADLAMLYQNDQNRYFNLVSSHTLKYSQ